MRRPGPESIQALIGGSMDIATAAGVSAAVGTFAKGAPIRIIGSEMIGSPDLYWYVPASSPIKKVEDFNGKTVAFRSPARPAMPALLALIAQYKLTAKPTSTGNIAATITQTMTGQVDVGFGAAPFGLDLAEDGKIRIIATGSDVTSLRSRSVRVNLTNVNTLQNRRDALVRFNRAYAETVDWMYSDPAALKHTASIPTCPKRSCCACAASSRRKAWRPTGSRASTGSWRMRWRESSFRRRSRPSRSRN